MNLGKSYIKALLSDEQRLEEVERKFDVILEKIQRYDEVLDKFIILQKELYNLASNLKNLEDKTNRTNIALEDHLSRISSQLKQSDFQQRNLESYISQAEKKIEDHRQESNKRNEEAQEKIAIFRTDISKLESRFILKERFECLFIDLDKEFDSFDKGISELQKNENFRNQKISEHSAKISELENRFNAQNPDLILQKFENALEGHKKITKDDLLTAMTISNNRMLDLKDATNDQIKLAKTEILGTPSSLETVRKEIMNKLEMTSLDATNATIKTGNAQKKLDLLEKKIEMINLIMQKNDIK